MVIEVDGVILNMDNISVIRMVYDVNERKGRCYVLYADNTGIYWGTKEKTEEFYKKLWAEIEKKERILVTLNEHGNYIPIEY